MDLPVRVTITEVGPRDGLQNEKQPVATRAKIELCERLLAAGVRNLEATSFVSPKWVPQMADAAEVMAGIPRGGATRISVLTPNMKGLENAIAAHADEVVIFGAASEAFSQRNINCSIAESIERFGPVARAAREAGLRVRGAVSVAFGCPYQGEVALASVIDVVRRMRDLDCDEIGIAGKLVALVEDDVHGDMPGEGQLAAVLDAHRLFRADQDTVLEQAPERNLVDDL
ncbi:MAG: hydroxymethylglutaryl-CoA lyase, partial [Burkholderiaceae bacterium]|nr:hydroxymethylglutaryl-CoA lyase [Burkholderiaceae bacterium]